MPNTKQKVKYTQEAIQAKIEEIRKKSPNVYTGYATIYKAALRELSWEDKEK